MEQILEPLLPILILIEPLTHSHLSFAWVLGGAKKVRWISTMFHSAKFANWSWKNILTQSFNQLGKAKKDFQWYCQAQPKPAKPNPQLGAEIALLSN